MQHTNRTDGGAVGLKTEWFAFRVRGKHEKSVAFHRREKREVCFVPMVQMTRANEWPTLSYRFFLVIYSAVLSRLRCCPSPIRRGLST
jgi:hypothetical protein